MCALSSFLGLPSRRRCALAVALHRHDSGLDPSHTRNYSVFMKYLAVYGHKQINIHTTSANAVTLVWGLLKLAPKSSFVHNSGKCTQRQAPTTHILTHVDYGGQPSVLKNKLPATHMLTHMPTIKLDLLGG